MVGYAQTLLWWTLPNAQGKNKHKHTSHCSTRCRMNECHNSQLPRDGTCQIEMLDVSFNRNSAGENISNDFFFQRNLFLGSHFLPCRYIQHLLHKVACFSQLLRFSRILCQHLYELEHFIRVPEKKKKKELYLSRRSGKQVVRVLM